jgi:DNA topoisomerase I
MSVDPTAIAAEAGLRYVTVDDLAVRRIRRGRGFSYRSPDGPVDGERRAWIEQLAIPPAWTDVVVAADPRSHILAVGTDEAGRRQYRYHTEFRRVADEVKFARLPEIGERLPKVRAAAAEAVQSEDPRRQLLGLVIRLIDTTLIRVGTERYAEENESFGASTLRCDHVAVTGGRVSLCFAAKGGKEFEHAIDDPWLATFAARRLRVAGDDDPLFATDDGAGVDGGQVAAQLTEWSGVEMSAKDLRTWGASATMVGALMSGATPTGSSNESSGNGSSNGSPVLTAFDVVAERLNNTRTVTRESYVSPTVVAAFESGDLHRHWRASRASARRSREEGGLLRTLSSAHPA